MERVTVPYDSLRLADETNWGVAAGLAPKALLIRDSAIVVGAVVVIDGKEQRVMRDEGHARTDVHWRDEPEQNLGSGCHG